MTRERTSPPSGSGRGARAARSAPPVSFDPELPKAARPARGVTTPDEGLDAVSEQLALVLERADGLLADWSSFGTRVRSEVEDAASTVGEALGRAVASATLESAQRAAAASRDAVEAATRRSLEEQVGAQLRAVAHELAALEARARAAAHHAAATRRRERSWLLVAIAVLAASNLALVGLLFVRTGEPAPPAPREQRTPAPGAAPLVGPPAPQEPAGATSPPLAPTTPAPGDAAPAAAAPPTADGAPSVGPAPPAPASSSPSDALGPVPTAAPSRAPTPSKKSTSRRTPRPAAAPAQPPEGPAR